MHNFSDNMIRDARTDQISETFMDDSSNPKTEKVITFRDRDYLLYEGRIIDEKEADHIYTQYYKMLYQKQKNQNSGAAFGNEAENNNEASNTSDSSGLTIGSACELGISNAQWKKDETMLLQFIIFNVADQRDKLVEDFSDSDWLAVGNLVPGRSSLQCQKRWLFIQNIEGKKSAWTAGETELLKQIAEQITSQSG